MTPELYPNNFLDKIGFITLRQEFIDLCSSSLGKSIIEDLSATIEVDELNRRLQETNEMLNILGGNQSLPSLQLVDCRLELQALRPEGTFLEEIELHDLRQMLGTLHALSHFFLVTHKEGQAEDETLSYKYPELSKLYQDAPLFPKIEQNLNQILDLDGRIKDTASRELLRIRQALRETERSLSGMMGRIIRQARQEGWIDQDTQASIRDGRLVVPVAPQHKRKIKGIVHDESATGKTVFIEPVELVEANNQIRELEGEERRELTRILIEISNRIRPNITHLLRAYELIAYTDATLAKARWAERYQAICPNVKPKAHISWSGAKHPLLMRSLAAQGKSIVPLDIQLDDHDGRILVISGPNAGGKSVCLKTVGLLQYMLQCGLPIPVLENSEVGIFHRFYLDIGDEQSLEDDLSTYSSHLRNMKHFERFADGRSLIMIDEFGGGTEPTIGGAIAQVLLKRFNDAGAYGLITTHYQNLKNFAEDTTGIVNGAMLYDRHEMRPLFRLSIGRPGSSFAVEIARKIGLPEDLIAEASDIVGSEYVDMDKYLQDIIRDKRYWEQKRQNIRKEERKLQEAADKYTEKVDETERQRKDIIATAKKEAQRLIQEASARIERTIKEIREAEAERERTLGIRQSLKAYAEELAEEEQVDIKEQEKARREVEKLLRRRERKAKGGHKHREQEELAAKHLRGGGASQREQSVAIPKGFEIGDAVRLEGQKTIAHIVEIAKGEATIAIGMIKMNVPLERLRSVSEAQIRKSKSLEVKSNLSGGKSVIDQIHDKRLTFKQDIDLRGMRVAEGVDAVRYFIDDALQLGIAQVRILHGTGTGALKQAIRAYLAEVKEVCSFADEHVQLGGAGITVVHLL